MKVGRPAAVFVEITDLGDLPASGETAPLLEFLERRAAEVAVKSIERDPFELVLEDDRRTVVAEPGIIGQRVHRCRQRGSDLRSLEHKEVDAEVMKMLLVNGVLHGDALTITGQTVAEVLEEIPEDPSPDQDVIQPWQKPLYPQGHLVILKGNLAEEGGVAKVTGLKNPKITGPARVFDTEDDASEAIMAGRIKKGEVVVIRYEGPKGGPGMREMYKAMKLLYGRGLARKTALVTDGRFSGTNNGCFVGHISPEAADGGPLAIVEDGDEITIDIVKRKLHLHLPDSEIQKRLSNWQRPPAKFKSGYLALYSRLAESADKGAVIKHKFE